ncbi:MAG: SNF2-related protein [Cyanobacteria bacterium P01_F01_bin.150]
MAQTWNPEIADQDVRLKSNPGRRGKTTGKVRQAGTRLLVEVQFGPAEKTYKPQNLLELCGDDDSIAGLMRQGRYGGPDDLRRILTFEKLKGQLTNVFYSMESSQTTFYAHQFKPVLKFLNSPVGRILIADEVGLGKTVEAMYIWKELQSREDARRLLIICPAMLRQKWQDDLLQRFNIFADIVDAKELLNRSRLCLENQRKQPSFVCIASLEGLRPPSGWEEPRATSARAELARLLDDNPASNEFSLFNLVIIDEAHYLRNATTANHRIGQLARDASHHLLLLTATPIQTDSTNLYQLLRLLSPEDFFNEDVFDQMLEANQPVVHALRYLWTKPANAPKAKESVQQASKSSYFVENALIKQIAQTLEGSDRLTDDQRVDLGYKLEKVSLLSQYLTRSRKRDVLPNRVKRDPQTLTVHFSEPERQIYETVTEEIRQQAQGQKGTSLLSLVARQRQMASCMVAALETWQSDGILDDLVNESLWEDFGVSPQLREPGDPYFASSNQRDRSRPLFSPNVSPSMWIEKLEAQDSKYAQLVEFLKDTLDANPAEKFVIFAYFRGTLTYLERRLKADRISTCLIMGDMGDRKWDVVEHFRQDDGPSVLLSSEVGSEGIDLQHCHFLVNYDLPWNPMRVEQRIGRLDRLGQKAERISIINFSLVNTVEERILEKLYERIDIFKESIGDLENILGDMTEELIAELFNPNLSPAEKEKRAIETGDALKKNKLLQTELENEAVNMMAFSDHILDSINNSREQGRWLQPEEMQSFVEDCFARYYPGTIIKPLASSPGLFHISLSEKAKVDLGFFVSQNRCVTPTRLHTSGSPIGCFFNPKQSDHMGQSNELLDPTHPLILWIRDRYATAAQSLHPVSAIQASPNTVKLVPGLYAYSVHVWTFQGLKTESQLAYKIINVNDKQFLSDQQSESVLATLMKYGRLKPNAHNFVGNSDRLIERQKQCDAYLEDTYGQAIDDFYIDNDNRCNTQENSARAFAARRQKELSTRLERFRQEGKTQIIPATEGQLRKVNRELDIKLKSIEEKRDNVSFKQTPLASGIIFIED